jgi:type IV pilus assembly PilO-like protein
MPQKRTQTEIIKRDSFYKRLKKNPLAYASADFLSSVLLIVFLFIAAIRPTILAIKKIQLKNEEMITFNTSLLSKISTLEKLTPQYQRNMQFIDLVHQAVPNKHDFPVFEKQIRFLIQKNRLEPLAVSFSQFPLIKPEYDLSEPKKTSSRKERIRAELTNNITFSATVQGSYADIKSFLTQIQNLIRITKIGTVSIERSKQTDTAEQLVLTVRGNAYFDEKFINQD